MIYDQIPPIGEICEDCGEVIENDYGTHISCSNGCFEDDTRNYLSFNYR